jgi:hypothetical protein
MLTFRRPGYLFAISSATQSAVLPRPEPQNRRALKSHLLRQSDSDLHRAPKAEGPMR